MTRIAVCRPVLDDFERTLSVPGVDVVVGPKPPMATAELHNFVKGAHAIVTWMSERVDDAFLDAAGDQLKIITQCAVGYDNIDVAACTKRSITVTNTPDMVTEGTADVAWCLLMAAARRVGEGDRFVRSKAWEAHGGLGPTEFLGVPIAGQTLLIVGAGRIGYATALRSMAWGMRVLYASRSPKPQFELAPLNAEHVSLEEGLEQADFVSVHTPLTPVTKHLLKAEHFARMKKTAVLVSTARGPVIDEAALAAALKSDQIFAAGLDVFEEEPRVHPELINLENTVFTPHFGSGDTRCRGKMAALCAQNINRVLAGEEPVTRVAS